MSEQSLPSVEYTFTLQDGPDGSWELESYHFDEELNGISRLSVDIRADELPSDIAEFLGVSCELLMEREGGNSQHVYGVVVGVDFLGAGVLRLFIRSAFELAQQRVNSRIWQETPVCDIVAEVLDEAFADHGRTYCMDGLSRGKQPRTYCVQYRESDHDFVCRLLEEEGISFFYNHDPDAGHEVLTLADDNSHYPDAESFSGGADFPWLGTSQGRSDGETIHDLDWSQHLTTTEVLRRDFDWLTPKDLLTAEAAGTDNRDRVRRVYDHDHRRFERDDLDERRRDLADALALSGNVARGYSNAIGIRPGRQFTTDALDHAGGPDKYIVTRVTHSGSGANSGGGQDYTNTFECVPATRVVRPLRRTPKPRVHGPQTATVVGDGEIHTDEHGRIQVQFHWEEDASFGEGASCWIRCAQSWSGGGWGAQFIPRVGMEVLVEFLEGNPDRPLVTGCVYNGENSYPFAVPGSATQSGWRTNSSPGGGGSNELRFDDAAGAEEIYIHGQKDWNVSIVNCTSVSTGVDESRSIGNDLSQTVGNNETEEVGVDKAVTIGSNLDETVGASMTLTVGADQTVTIGANQSVTVGANQTTSIGASASETVAVAKSITVGGLMDVAVGGALNTAVGAACMEEVGGLKSVSVGAASSLSVVGSHSVSAANISESAGKQITLNAGTDFAAQGGKKVAIGSGGPFGANAKTKFTIEAGDEFLVKCGSATFSMKKNGEIVIKGKKITVNASGDIVLKANKIKEN
ncbi:MAG TPA: type VI secretion system tip protein TssI/VgrG [Enhygromyxa sp.]|nr:type VI secretion system tip protein TssI/VgrG [Enhygromyxa sp.]